MPKKMFVDTEEVRKPGKLSFTDIPMNVYQKPLEQELSEGAFTPEELKTIYHDMYMIRTFEEMLHTIKVLGMYRQHKFSYTGPAHLSIGEEAYAVGEAFLLDENDFIFGSHRGHHEVLAKAMSAIRKIPEEKLLEIMISYHNGVQYRIVRHRYPNVGVRELARKFFLYGMMSEIFAKDTGFGHGLGGSMHVFFTPFGIYPNNAIVGASACTATGAALYKKCNQKSGIVVANLGDGSMGRGPVWESINFSSMDQYHTLWEDGYNRGGLPIIFNIANNHYGMGGQTRGETMAFQQAARFGAGVAPNELHAERVDGYNPLAVIDAYRRKRKIIEEEGGPVLLEVMTYRLTGHSTSDGNPSYRTKEELEAWKTQDSIPAFEQALVRAGVTTAQELAQLREAIEVQNEEIFLLASDPEISPLADLRKNPGYVENVMLSHGRAEKLDDRTPEVNDLTDNPRLQQIAKRTRLAIDSNGQELPKSQAVQIRDALFESLLYHFEKDPTMISYAEDIRDWGGSYAVYRGLSEALPYHRMFNAPISESAIVGSAVGYAMAGGRAVVELMFADFLGCAGDEIFNQMAKWQAMSGGALRMPVVLRATIGSKYGAQHSQDPSSLVAHIPGLKVVMPATPYDAKGLMNSALVGTDPVVFFECQRIYDQGELFHAGGVPEEYYEIPIGEPDVKLEGSNVTILTVGATLYRALEAAKRLKAEFGISAEIIDARTLVPFSYEKLLASVKKTGFLLLVADAVSRGGFLNDIAANVTRMAFDDLDAPPIVLGARNWIAPAFEYDKEFAPQAQWMIDAIHENFFPLKNYTPVYDMSNSEMIRRAKLGV